MGIASAIQITDTKGNRVFPDWDRNLDTLIKIGVANLEPKVLDLEPIRVYWNLNFDIWNPELEEKNVGKIGNTEHSYGWHHSNIKIVFAHSLANTNTLVVRYFHSYSARAHLWWTSKGLKRVLEELGRFQFSV